MIAIDGRPVVTAARMRAAEQQAIDDGATEAALIERAGSEVARAVARLAGASEILVLCGPGNNGGDGYVAAAALAGWGHKVRVAAAGEPRGAAIAARACWIGPVASLADAAPAPVVVDALFGTGLTRPLAAEVAQALARFVARAQLVVAVDLPSGFATDDGAILSDAARADVTLALGALKPSHLLQPAAARCGTVRLLDIGVAVTSDDVVLARPSLATPGAGDHKYTRGLAAVIAGAMPGAAALAAGAAARIAGYVLLLGSATDRVPHAIVRRRWSADALGDARIGAVLIGPGLGRDDHARERLDAALASDRPLVLDGDALRLLDLDRLASRTAPTILTPHAGEFAHLFGVVGGSKIERARAAAVATGTTIVFKGTDTVVAHHDGRTRIAAQAVPWLATAGTGDVLAGIVAGLLAHGHAPFAAACDAVWLHTEAARRAGAAFIADELLAALARAIGDRA